MIIAKDQLVDLAVKTVEAVNNHADDPTYLPLGRAIVRLVAPMVLALPDDGRTHDKLAFGARLDALMAETEDPAKEAVRAWVAKWCNMPVGDLLAVVRVTQVDD